MAEEFTFSNLRLFGLIAGLLVCLYFAYLRRRYRSREGGWPLLILIGVPLIVISLFPGILDVPSEIFFARDRPGGRLDVLLIVSVIVLWLLAVRNRLRVNRIQERSNRLLQHLAVSDFEQRNSGTPMGGCWVTIPVLDEAENLRELLPRIPQKIGGRPVHVLVIDDGSTDGSAGVARNLGAQVVSMPMNIGGGLALKTGFMLAMKQEADIVVTMDGDGQHLPDEIPGLVEPIVDDAADIVIGSRLLGQAEKISSLRTLGLDVFNAIISVLMGVKVTDCASGFRAISGSTLKRLKLQQEQYHTAEMIIEALKHGQRFTERPITIRKRAHGHSKKGRDLFYGVMFMRTVIKTWLR